MTLAKGMQLGRYEIRGELGAGGMGEVYRARDPRLEREVAIKVLPERLASDQDALKRFRRENKVVAALSHPNIRAIYDVDEDQGRTFAVMELLEGETLASRIKLSSVDRHEAVHIASAVAEGLAAAHDHGIVHRDIKPHNIFLTTTSGIKVLDFGLAAWGAHAAAGAATHESTVIQSTQPGLVLGTVPYMSPEQVRGHAADARSDIFGLGCVLYEMLAGVDPFRRGTTADTMAAILMEEAAGLSDAKLIPSSELRWLVARCLAKEPENRFQSMRELVLAIAQIEHEWKTTQQVGGSGNVSERQLLAGDTHQPNQVAVAVLPFVNLSSDQENEHFSDGLAEELINSLSKIRRLYVASRTSCFAFKGSRRDIREIGQQLNVRAILEGSVRRTGDRLRISTQLVDVADGYQRWSGTYDRKLEDVFAVQDEIARNIVQALEVVLSDSERRTIGKAPTGSVEAYEYYLRGRQYFHQFRREGFERARKLFLRACELDPDYASAYAGVASCCCLLYRYCDAAESYLHEADEASRKALRLDPQLAEAHVARGLLMSLNRRFNDARAEFESAIRQNSESFDAYYFYARSCFAEGQFEQAARWLTQASRVNPHAFDAPLLHACVCEGLGKRADAEAANRRGLEAAEKYLELFPDDGRALCLGALAAVRLGLHQRGSEWAQRALVADPQDPIVLHLVACTYAWLGQTDAAIDRLEQAVSLGMRHKGWLENDTDLRALHGHPRFQALLERLKPDREQTGPIQT